jgi:hypothetical protein
MTSPFKVGAAGVCDCADCRCEEPRPCACGLPSRPGFHGRDACGLADGSVRDEATSPRHGQRPRVNGRRCPSPTYYSWFTMIQRCTNPAHKQWKNYGGRGVAVCERWHSLAAFVQDMGERPAGTTLDRINGALGYEPGNCRWATPLEQQRNKSTTRFLTVRGETLALTAWAERTGLGESTIRERLRRGWSPEDAVSASPRQAGWRLGKRTGATSERRLSRMPDSAMRHGTDACGWADGSVDEADAASQGVAAAMTGRA